MNPDFFTIAKTEAGDCGNNAEIIPEWVDKLKLRRGQNFYQKYFFSVYTSCLSSLCAGFCIPSLVSTLVFTGESETIPKMFKRYLRTIQSMDKWYCGDIWDKDGETFHSLQQVRQIHSHVSTRLMKSDNAPTNGIAISQYDMVLTQLAFMGVIVIWPQKFGCSPTIKEVEGLMHFWHCIGYLLGIDEKYNLCAGTYEETIVKCHQLVELEMKPNLLNPPPDFEPMARSLLIALHPIIPWLDYDTYSPFTFQIYDVPFVCSTNGKVSDVKTTSVISSALQITTNYLLFISPIRVLLNWLLYQSIQRAADTQIYGKQNYFSSDFIREQRICDICQHVAYLTND